MEIQNRTAWAVLGGLALLLLGLLFASQPAYAAPPANDNISGAANIYAIPNTPIYATNEATLQQFEPQPCGGIGATVWVKATFPDTGKVTVATDAAGGPTTFDTVVAVYLGTEVPSFGSLVLVGCDDDSGEGTQSRITFTAEAGLTYYFQIGGFNGAVGQLYFGYEYANNNVADAREIGSFPYGQFFNSLRGANTELGEQAPCGSTGVSVWYKWTSPITRRLSIDTYTSNANTILAVYSGPSSGATAGSLTHLACNNDVVYTAPGDGQLVFGNNSRVAFEAQTGVTYYFQLFYQSQWQAIYLRLELENDNTVNPVNASPFPFTHSQSTTTATTQFGEPQPCGAIGKTVWFEYTPAVNSFLTADTIGSNFDTVLAVYSAQSAARNWATLGLIACDDDGGGSFSSRLQFNATAGQRYVFQVGGFQGLVGDLVFTLQSDADFDAVLDLADNCPTTPNGPGQSGIFGVGNQSDADGDGVPGTQPPPGGTFGGNACDSDDDNDGIDDNSDSCPFLAEDLDGFQDSDGCPEGGGPPDSDFDGICDPGFSGAGCTGSDMGKMCFDPAATLTCNTTDCRYIIEDYDAFQDTDGCPEPDNDNDGFPDVTDDCPGTDSRAGPDGMLGSPQDLNHNGVRDGAEAALTTDDVMPALVWEDSDGVLDTDGCHDSPGDDFDGDGFTDDAEVFTHLTDAGNPDTDGDAVVDGTDNCPNWVNALQTLPSWTVPVLDSDCDGYAVARERHVGTDPTAHCAADTVPNNEALDAWPPDFNDNQIVNLSDVLAFNAVWAQSNAGANVRFDLFQSAGNIINLSDVLAMNAHFGLRCAPLP